MLALASTVTELRERVGDTASQIKTITSPTHIKQEIRDYVRQEREGLVDAVQRLKKIERIGLVFLDATDIVRHPLVQRIVAAYEGEAPRKRSRDGG